MIALNFLESMSISDQLIKAARCLSDGVQNLTFSSPVTHVYNPLTYAWDAHAAYIRKWGNSTKKILFMGMNPGPYGMAQTGIPFGEIAHVRDWIGISVPVDKPSKEHPKRVIEGFKCERSEVSGRRLWGFFKEQFGSPDAFFQSQFVLNYCPLVFMEASGRNRTPDKLTAEESEPLYALCDAHLRAVLRALEIESLVAVGTFAENRAYRATVGNPNLQITRILHPSPASPLANNGWGDKVLVQLKTMNLGLW